MTQAKKYAAVFGAGLLAAALLAASYGLGRDAGLREAARALKAAPADTVTITRTVRVKEPPISGLKPVRVLPALLPLYAPGIEKEAANPGDSVAVAKDSAAVAVPIEQAFYSGDEYDAWVSGFRPRLDSLYVYPKTVTITTAAVPAPPSRWTFGITAGPGVFWGPEGVRPGLGVVAGLQFRF